MRKKIAAANWKMNLNLHEAESLVDDLLKVNDYLNDHQQVLLAVPFPYLLMVQHKCAAQSNINVCAQNIASTSNGAYTGEVSAAMLQGMNIGFTIIGHSERRMYFQEDNLTLAKKVDLALQHGIQPVFCCGESLQIRDQNQQNDFVANQLKDSLFHLSEEQMKSIIIAYEPIWAIGTGKTATSEQAQEMHAHIRAVIASQYGQELANTISILYGGSVKASNAVEIFSSPDVDGGLVGGASLIASEFIAIIKSLP